MLVAYNFLSNLTFNIRNIFPSKDNKAIKIVKRINLGSHKKLNYCEHCNNCKKYQILQIYYKDNKA